MLQFQTEYIAAGGNRHPSAADWDSSTGLLAFGADRNVAFWSPLSVEGKGLHRLLSGHTDIVNAVKFFAVPNASFQIILSGSVDKSIRIWKISKAASACVATLERHTSSINCLAIHPDSNFFASGAADGTVRIWQLSLNQDAVNIKFLQSIEIRPRFFPLDLVLHPIGVHGDVVLAVAGTKGIVQVYLSSDGGLFELQATLTGHEGWIRSLSIAREDTSGNGDILLASASQDKYIRLWRISTHLPNEIVEPSSLTGALEDSLSNKRHKLKSSGENYLLTFEALLLGHEDWIYTISWRLNDRKLQLLSTSADNSLAIWEAEESSGIWVSTTRLGEISAMKGSTTATGSTGGFWIGLWSPNGQSIACLGRTGSWRLWNHDKTLDRWIQGIGISGHTKKVTDIAWSKHGGYILSTSSDQTTRLHAQQKLDVYSSWHEMARPQIHGYDLNCIDMISNSQFISGADEKLLRIFDQPRSTAELLRDLCNISTLDEQEMPAAATIPVLGLSNKIAEKHESVEDTAGGEVDEEMPPHSVISINGDNATSNPPYEDRLARHTLWPEREKLYGHGYGISAVAASHDGTVIATSCKASSIDHAVIRLYTTADWREVKPSLTAHSLTITALAFSDNDQYLLSVGRDRQWTIFERGVSAPHSYSMKHSNSKGHSRMILDACWAPNNAADIFATAGRDKLIKIWRMNESNVECLTTITAGTSVTALDIAPQPLTRGLFVASGEESGAFGVHTIDPISWTIMSTSVPEVCQQPSKGITCVRWRPDEQSSERLTLAVASEDSSLRIFHLPRKH